MIGIIGALDYEVDALKAAISDAQTQIISGAEYVSGEIHSMRVVVARAGVGKVCAAVCAQTMILKYGARSIINTGVGGALDPALRVGDIVIGTHCVQHDFDTTACGDKAGIRFPLDALVSASLARAIRELNEARAFEGIIATGDQFVADAEAKARITRLFGARVCEMEGAAIAQVCSMNQIPCALMRAISDGADEGAPMSFDKFARMAAGRSARAVLLYIKKLSERE